MTWKPPLETNGVLTGYEIKYQMLSGDTTTSNTTPMPGHDTPGVIPMRKNITDPNQTQTKLAGLKPATRYRVYIYARTKMGIGER